MARHKFHRAIPEPEPALEIASLIDICFLLLIYFIATCTITQKEQQLDLKLPAPRETPEHQPPIPPLFIEIQANGGIFTGKGADRQPMDQDTSVRELPLLRGYLDTYSAAARAAGDTPMIAIEADDQASQQRVIDVLNTLNATGIRAVTFTDLTGPAL